jgi:DNA-binding NtrC family response regulator
MNNAEIIQRLDLLASAINAMAQAMGTRLNRAQLCERMGIHRNTLARRLKDPGFPLPDRYGYWLLADVMKWEQGNLWGRS